MVIIANLIFSADRWLLPAACVLGLLVLVLLWGYWKVAVPGVTRFWAFFFKVLGILALLLCLLEPLWSGERPKVGANYFAILGDNSQGMQIKDPGAEQSRGEHLRTLLIEPAGQWTEKLNELFQVRYYTFDSRLHGVKDFADLQFKGRASAMGTAIRNLADRFQGQPLAGVLLLSDGNATDIVDGSFDPSGLPPIYPIVLGTDEPINDISIRKVSVSQTAFEDAPVTIHAEVDAGGFAGEEIIARIFPAEQGNSDDAVDAQEQTKEISGDRSKLNFRFQFRPEKPGVSFYQLQVELKQNQLESLTSDINEEATLANNQRVVVVDRGGGPYRILYAAGRAHWEFKFLNRALYEDDQVKLVALIRIATRQPRFVFKGRSKADDTNPLYKGFDKTDELTEQYDQAVYRRILASGDDTGQELAGGFPKKPEELYKYTAVILDDLEAAAFTRDQMSLLQRYISERGGGLLMLGGFNSLREGDYDRTPIGAMLPIYLDRTPETDSVAEVRLDLTREGWLKPWTRLRKTEDQERERLESMPNFKVLNLIGDSAIKPGASVAMTAKDTITGESHPALVTQRYGLGRTAVMTIGDFWRWHMRDTSGKKEMAKAWRQLVRRLIADVPDKVNVDARPIPGDPNQAMAIQIRARDQKFWPMDNANVELAVRSFTLESESALGTEAEGELQTLKTNIIKLSAEASIHESGLYEAVFVPRDTGGYAVEATVTDMDGLAAGRAETGWSSDPAAEEFRSLTPNRALMESIADKTGGEVIDASKLSEFVGSLPSKKVPIMETWTYPLWHTPVMFLLALACFAIEWGLRRTRGMA